MNGRCFLLGLCCLILAGCGAAVGVGNGGVENLATTKIRTGSEAAVRSAVLEVFKSQGFRVLSEGSQSITFSKRGGRSADIAWSTMANPNPVMIRPTVSWRKAGSGEVFVSCQVEIAQLSTVYGETVRQPMVAGKSAYNGMLRDVKRRVEKGS